MFLLKLSILMGFRVPIKINPNIGDKILIKTKIGNHLIRTKWNASGFQKWKLDTGYIYKG